MPSSIMHIALFYVHVSVPFAELSFTYMFSLIALIIILSLSVVQLVVLCHVNLSLRFGLS